jgi:SAM-dependent methyltransferase
MAGGPSEPERLQLQSRVWEPAGRALLREIGRAYRRGVDLGCGALGWLRLLGEVAAPGGEVVGTDVEPSLLAAARAMLDQEGLRGVTLREDDLFASRLDPASFDLVHARFQIAPLGRAAEQLALCRRLAAPGGVIVLEDPDSGSWHFNPPAPAAERLIALILRGFVAAGGDFDAGRRLPALLASAGLEPRVRAEVVALPPGHPYLRLPVQFSVSLEPLLVRAVPAAELARLRAAAEREIADPARWGTTFTLVQAWATAPSSSVNPRAAGS